MIDIADIHIRIEARPDRGPSVHYIIADLTDKQGVLWHWPVTPESVVGMPTLHPTKKMPDFLRALADKLEK